MYLNFTFLLRSMVYLKTRFPLSREPSSIILVVSRQRQEILRKRIPRQRRVRTRTLRCDGPAESWEASFFGSLLKDLESIYESITTSRRDVTGMMVILYDFMGNHPRMTANFGLGNYYSISRLGSWYGWCMLVWHLETKKERNFLHGLLLGANTCRMSLWPCRRARRSVVWPQARGNP